MSRILAIDLGSRRIGIALSDPTGSVASPLDTLPYQGRGRALTEVAAVARSHDVARIVVGWPRNMNGTSGPAAKEAEAFADALRPIAGVPVDLWDERLSTIAAERALRGAGARRDRRRAARDRVAAALILESYLAAQRVKSAGGSH